jgi:predicted CoA-binding protein
MSSDTAQRTWQGPSAARRREILLGTRTIAIVGASANPARASYFVNRYLTSTSDYTVWLVNPTIDEVEGTPVYPSLADLPAVPDMVDVFRRHDDLPSVLDDTLAVGASTLWLQLGLWHEEVARRAEEAGLAVVMDRCVKIEHARFHGGLHLAGFDTGVIDSRRRSGL